MDDHLSYILTDLGEERERYFNAMAPPVIQSSNFLFPDVGSFRKALLDEANAHIYTRGNNPTVEILRKKMAALEGTDDALIFASGSAAISMAIMHCVKQGDHIICVRNPYSWTTTVIKRYLARFGITHDFVDGRDIENIRAAVKPNTKLLFLESPNTFTYELQDLAACAALAKAHGFLTAIDNTCASPLYQQPAKYGIDIVIHTLTKYINGHSDVVGGAVCASHEIIGKLFIDEYMTLGGIISPHDAAMVIRGLRTLPMRMRWISESTGKIVSALKGHPKIGEIRYPFDPDFPQYALARKQMSGCGGLFTVALNVRDIEEVLAIAGRIRRWKIAVSWGGHESLMLPTAALYDLPGRDNPQTPWNYVRFYVGLEEPEYLLEDLLQALA